MDDNDLIWSQVESLQSRVASKGSEGNISDVIVAQIQEPELRQSVHHEAQIAHLLTNDVFNDHWPIL